MSGPTGHFRAMQCNASHSACVPIQVAIRSSSADMIRLFLARGAEFNSLVITTDYLFKTAIKTCSLEIVLILVDTRAIVNPNVYR